MWNAQDSAKDRVNTLDMAAIINSTCKTFCSSQDIEIRKTQFYLGYYENLELRKVVETTKHESQMEKKRKWKMRRMIRAVYFWAGTMSFRA